MSSDRDKLEDWAKNQVDTLHNTARLAQNCVRTAERDLASIMRGFPTQRCLDRYHDWKASQPKEKP